MMSLRFVPILTCMLVAGCAAIPDVRHEPQFHNPFPQLHRVAILPFYNLSSEPTVSQDEVAEAYYNELQRIPGFEVMPPGVVKKWLEANRVQIDSTTDFQLLARGLDVDVLIRGAVTEYSPYYPPRIGLSVDWFAANPSFHPIPPGYGLPWGTPEEEYIPKSLVFEAEFALAREQLKTQTPEMPPGLSDDMPTRLSKKSPVARVAAQQPAKAPAAAAKRSVKPPGIEQPPGSPTVEPLPAGKLAGEPILEGAEDLPVPGAPNLPPDWPDPRGFIPPPPSPVRPPYCPQHEPVITHTRIYHGDDERLTERLEDYFFFRDDARYGGWQGYLLRSQDFIRFCCYLHITETLAARGGTSETRVVWRWPIGRYDVGTGRR